MIDIEADIKVGKEYERISSQEVEEYVVDGFDVVCDREGVVIELRPSYIKKQKSRKM